MGVMSLKQVLKHFVTAALAAIVAALAFLFVLFASFTLASYWLG